MKNEQGRERSYTTDYINTIQIMFPTMVVLSHRYLGNSTTKQYKAGANLVAAHSGQK